MSHPDDHRSHHASTEAEPNADAKGAPARANTHAQHAGHDKHAGHNVAMFRDRFWISLALTVPTLVWGHMLQRAFGYSAPHFAGSMWIPVFFGTAVFLYGGVPFLRGALHEL